MESQPEDIDDIPVSELIARKMQAASASAAETAAPVSAAFTAASVSKEAKETPVDSDSDDDIPVLTFIKKRLNAIAAEEAKAASAEREKRKREEKEAAERKREKSSRKESESTEKPKVSPALSSNKASQFYSSCDKGRLVQTLLVRWWYAYEWPTAEDIGTPPQGYEALDGYPGVFVSTRLDSLGTILDRRNMERIPSLSNFSRKSSQELKDMCILALQNQMQKLEEAEGNQSKLYSNLKAELSEIKRIDTAAADKHGKKYDGWFQKSATVVTASASSSSETLSAV